MSKRNRDEYRQNAAARRGIVVDRDPAKMRVKVQFRDEDETVSHWIDVVSPSSTGTRVFSMPGVGDEAWCAMDAKGEGGCIVGSRYNQKDAPPHDTNEDIAVQWSGGFIHINTGSGAVTVQTDGALTVKVGGSVTIEAGDIKLESGTLTPERQPSGRVRRVVFEFESLRSLAVFGKARCTARLGSGHCAVRWKKIARHAEHLVVKRTMLKSAS